MGSAMASAVMAINPQRSRHAAEDPRRSLLVASLRQRYAAAVRGNDAAAKQALFHEGVYLRILPQEFVDPA